MATRFSNAAASSGNPTTGNLRLLDVCADKRHLVKSEKPAALAFNPEADLATLLALLRGRAETLHQHLLNWACVSNSGDVDPSAVAGCLEPMAEEVTLIVDEVEARLKEAGHA